MYNARSLVELLNTQEVLMSLATAEHQAMLAARKGQWGTWLIWESSAQDVENEYFRRRTLKTGQDVGQLLKDNHKERD